MLWAGVNKGFLPTFRHRPLDILPSLLAAAECLWLLFSIHKTATEYVWRFQPVIFLQIWVSILVNVCPEICNCGLPSHKLFQSAGCQARRLLLSLCLGAHIGCALRGRRDNLPSARKPAWLATAAKRKPSLHVSNNVCFSSPLIKIKIKQFFTASLLKIHTCLLDITSLALLALVTVIRMYPLPLPHPRPLPRELFFVHQMSLLWGPPCLHAYRILRAT